MHIRAAAGTLSQRTSEEETRELLQPPRSSTKMRGLHLTAIGTQTEGADATGEAFEHAQREHHPQIHVVEPSLKHILASKLSCMDGSSTNIPKPVAVPNPNKCCTAKWDTLRLTEWAHHPTPR